MSQYRVELNLFFSDLRTNEHISGGELLLAINNDTLYNESDFSQKTIYLSFASAEEYRLRIKFSHPAFEILDTTVTVPTSVLNPKRRNKLDFHFDIKYAGQYVEGVDVYATYHPEIVFSSEQFSAADFQIDKNGELLILIYEKRLEKEAFIIHYKDKRIQRRIKVPFKATHLEKDYKGRIVIMGEENASYVWMENGDFRLVEVDIFDYNNQIAPIIDTFESKIYYSNFNEWYPAVDYFSVDIQDYDTIYNHLTHVCDDEIMELYLAEFKYVDVRTKLWAWDMERETGIDREIWVGASSFTNSLYYESVFAPMFVQNENVYVANHYTNQLIFCDVYEDSMTQVVPISYHKKNGKRKWARELLQDPITEKVYVRYNYVGRTWLEELNVEDGSTKPSIELFFRYAEKILLFDNQVYYIYRPFESSQKKFIYSERLD